MNISIMKFGEIQIAEFDAPTVLISINTEDERPVVEGKENLIDVLFLTFDDLEGPSAAMLFDPPANLFTDEQAQQVLDFVGRHEDKHVVCQCEAGISRSAGCAAALARIYDGDDGWIFQSPRYFPNMRVYRKILEARYGKMGEVLCEQKES